MKLPRFRRDPLDDRGREDASEAGSARHDSRQPSCPSSSGKPGEGSGGASNAGTCPASPMPQLKDICADEAEILAVAVVRYIASGAMTSDAACWDAAFDHADAHLGHHEGAAFVGAMASLMRAIRIERSVTWRFLPANCCRLRVDEIDLVALISAARGRRFEEVRSVARLITSTAHPERLTESARQAATAVEIARRRLEPLKGAPLLTGTFH